MRIIGNFQLFEGHTTGSVVVQNTSSKAIIATMQTNDEGWFEFTNLPDNTELKFYGSSGQEISSGTAMEAITSESKISYIAYFKPTMDAGLGIYLNAASTLIALHLESDNATDYETAATEVKTFLFDDADSFLTSGYTEDFYAMIAPGSVFDSRVFVHNATGHGSTLAYAKSLLSNEMTASNKTLLFADPNANAPTIDSEEAEGEVKTAQTVTGAPTIPTNSSWALNQTEWKGAISLQTNSLESNMKHLEEMTDAISYAASQSSTGETAESTTLSDIGGWAGDKMGGALAGYAASYGFSMLSKWVFNTKSPSKAIQGSLTKISTQMHQVITELASLKSEIKAVYGILSSVELNRIEADIVPYLSKIKRASQHVYNNSKTTSGFSSSEIKALRDKISNYEVLTSATTICGYLNTTIGTNLPSALSTSLLAKYPNLKSNENFYGTIQMIFAYYGKLVTQAVVLSVQVHNSKSNDGITNGSMPLNTSSHVADLYNEYLIGGNNSPALKGVLNTFQTVFTPYSNKFLPYFTPSVLPSDMAVGLLPQQGSQPSTLFYNKTANIFIFGYIGRRFLNTDCSSDLIR